MQEVRGSSPLSSTPSLRDSGIWVHKSHEHKLVSLGGCNSLQHLIPVGGQTTLPQGACLSMRISPLSRPTMPQTGGRSFAQVPCPGLTLARRRGGSSGSRCGPPSSPASWKVCRLQHFVVQRHHVAIAGGEVLEPGPQVQEHRAVAAQLAGQMNGGAPWAKPRTIRTRSRGRRLTPCRAEPVKALKTRGQWPQRKSSTGLAAPPVDDAAIVLMAAGADQAVGMPPVDRLGKARLYIHPVSDREIPGGLRTGAMWRSHPSIPRPHPAENYRHITWLAGATSVSGRGDSFPRPGARTWPRRSEAGWARSPEPMAFRASTS